MQLRVIVPPDRTDEVRALFERDRGTAHLTVQPGAAVDPAGDLVVGDVAREGVDGLVNAPRERGIDRDGGITMISVDAAVSSAARRAEERAPGDAADAVVWEQGVRTVDADSQLSVSYLAFLTIINDSPILVIGAMVLGPEFAPLAALAVAAVHRRPRIARHAAVSLFVGFALAIGITALAALAGQALGWFGTEVLTEDHPGTGFITRPDRWSLLVAILAGIAGVLSLTSTKSGALVGVFISVTTVPAAGEMGLSLALGGSAEFASAATQLGVNLAGILVAATATLALQHALWHRVPGTVPSLDRVRRPRQRSR